MNCGDGKHCGRGEDTGGQRELKIFYPWIKSEKNRGKIPNILPMSCLFQGIFPGFSACQSPRLDWKYLNFCDIPISPDISPPGGTVSPDEISWGGAPDRRRPGSSRPGTRGGRGPRRDRRPRASQQSHTASCSLAARSRSRLFLQRTRMP